MKFTIQLLIYNIPKFLFMSLLLKTRLPVAFCSMLFIFLSTAWAQPVTDLNVSPHSASEKGLFDSDEVLHITLRGNQRLLLNDRTDIPKDYPMVLAYTNENKQELNMPVAVRTRGHFRRLKENCLYPPLLIQFPLTGFHLSTVFSEQSKWKLVMPCRGDEYLIREWLVYRIGNKVLRNSFRSRLVRVKLEDTRTRKTIASFFGILLEEEKQMAKRNGAVVIKPKLRPQQTQVDAFLTMAVFEYLIGNTDWSVPYLHNIKLMIPDSTTIPIAVPYDFDHSGIVNAPYALPPEEMQLRSVSERRYRGYCIRDMKVFDSVLTRFNRLKNEIYSIYTDCTLLDEKYKKSTLLYLDEFYKTINNPKVWQKEFGYPCDKNGSGNIVVKGLKID